MSSVSCVASTAPWPGRAWSEWPCVITALSTGRVGSIWKPPVWQHTPDGVGVRRSSGRMAREICHIGAARTKVRHARATAFRLIRRSGRRPALPMGAGLSASAAIAAAAADILAQVVETAPGFATAWFALASIREATGRPRRRRRGVRGGARRRPRGLSRRAAASGAARRRRGDAGDDRRLCAPAVRPARAGVRPGAGGAARLSRAGAAARGGAAAGRPAVPARLGARSRLRHRAWAARRSGRSATGWSASIFRPA